MKNFPVEEALFRGQTLRVDALPLGVKRLVLARPQVRNAFDETMIEELDRVLRELAAVSDPAEMRLLILHGEGKVFCAGADLAYMKRVATRGIDGSHKDALALAALFHRLADFPTPVLAAVRGAAIGGGLGLTVCVDTVLAEESAVFATSEVRLGIVPAVISPYIVRRLGLANAASLMLTGRRISARQARELGVVQNVVPDDELDDALEKLVVEHLYAGPEAARRAKELIKRNAPLPSDEIQAFTARSIAEARCSEEARQGLEAFFQKAVPPWATRVKKL